LGSDRSPSISCDAWLVHVLIMDIETKIARDAVRPPVNGILWPAFPLQLLMIYASSVLSERCSECRTSRTRGIPWQSPESTPTSLCRTEDYFPRKVTILASHLVFVTSASPTF
jgi:hypothetical protein